MVNQLSRIRKTYKRKKQKCIFITHPRGRKAFILDTPYYDNLGDSAIVIAQILFLQKCGFSRERIKLFPYNTPEEEFELLKKGIKTNCLICGVGGGNLGNQWYPLELARYKIINAFPRNPIVIFPQTIHFTKDADGEKAKEKSKEYYNKQNVVLFTREQESYKQGKELYSNLNLYLSPDIVLSTTKKDFNIKESSRHGVLVVFRNDAEGCLNENDKSTILEYLKSNRIDYQFTDMITDMTVTDENRMELVSAKMQEFADAKIVITDRLHGMVFAALTETPCVVFSNYNHKVKGTYQWLMHLPYIKYVESVDKAIEYIPKLNQMQNCHFENAEILLGFRRLEELIKKYV